jgi:hypothetical protein
MHLSQFQSHFESHTSIPSSKCKKCFVEISKETIMLHLKGCHGFGNSNCAYCDFSTDRFDMLSIHLSNIHANKPLMIFDRDHKGTVATVSKFSQINSEIKEILLAARK